MSSKNSCRLAASSSESDSESGSDSEPESKKKPVVEKLRYAPNPESESDSDSDAGEEYSSITDAQLSMKSKLDDLPGGGKQLTGTTDEFDVIIDVFNDNITQLLKFLRSKQEDSPDVNALEDIVSEAVMAEPEIIIQKCKNNIWGAREHIKNENSKYFLDRDYSNLIKEDGNKNLIVGIVSLIKNGWNTLYRKERKFVWIRAKIMLKAVIIYNKWKQIQQ